MRLIQIPFSHNCIKVRRALELKGLAYETLDINPMDRKPVVAASGQGLVPVLQDGERCVAESTAILRHLEEAYPAPSLLPADPAEHASCWLIEDWADRAFMALTRRLAYWQRLKTPDVLAQRFFPRASGLVRKVLMVRVRQVLTKRFHLSAEQNTGDEQEVARVCGLALDRLAGRRGFFGDSPTVADVALATMAAPLHIAADQVRADPAVAELLQWAEPLLGDAVLRLYRAP